MFELVGTTGRVFLRRKSRVFFTQLISSVLLCVFFFSNFTFDRSKRVFSFFRFYLGAFNTSAAEEHDLDETLC